MPLPTPSTVPASRLVSPAMARGEPRLPSDWGDLDPAAKGRRLLHMAGSDTYHHFVRAMVREPVGLETVYPSTPPDRTPHPLEGATPLLSALHGKAWRNARVLIEAGSDLRATDGLGRHVWSHLLAHFPGDPQVDEEAIAGLTQALLAAGAGPNQRLGPSRVQRPRDNTALHLVYQTRRYHLVEPLLLAGADAHALAPTDDDSPAHGRSLLHDLMYFHDRRAPAEAVNELHRLLALGLDPNAAYGAGLLSNGRAARRTPLGVVPALDEVATALMRCGGNLGPDADGYRQAWLTEVVHHTLAEGRPSLLPALTALGMGHPEALRDHNGQSPLMALLDRRNEQDVLPQALEYLALFPDVDLMVQDPNGHGLAHMAAFQAHHRVLEWLLGLGASASLRDAAGETLLDELCKGPGYDNHPAAFQACARALFEAGLTPHTLFDGRTSPAHLLPHRTMTNRTRLLNLYSQWEREVLQPSVPVTPEGAPTPRARPRL